MVRLIAGLDARGRAAALAYIREREAEATSRAHEMYEALRAAGLDPDSVSAAPGEDAKKGEGK